MKNEHDILTKDDLVMLTGYQYGRDQCNWLSAAKIWFHPKKDGYPATTWHHVANPISLRITEFRSGASEPNFDAM